MFLEGIGVMGYLGEKENKEKNNMPMSCLVVGVGLHLIVAVIYVGSLIFEKLS